jgi:hypothetical protein
MAWKFSCTCAFGLFGLTTGCSDPVAPASQASASLYLTTAAMPPNARCTPGAHWINIPFSKGGGQTTNANARAGVAVDGVDAMGVKCSVKDGGGGIFQVSGELRSPAVDPQDMPVNPTLVTVLTQIAADQVGANGSISIIDSKSATTYSSDACSFTVRPPAGTLLGVAPGRMWASVSCPSFRDMASPDMDAVCQISQGYVVLENCSQ